MIYIYRHHIGQNQVHRPTKSTVTVKHPITCLLFLAATPTSPLFHILPLTLITVNECFLKQYVDISTRAGEGAILDIPLGNKTGKVINRMEGKKGTNIKWS